MAGDGVAAVAVDSPPSPSYSEEEEEYERSHKSKLREMIRLLKCPGGDVGGEEEDGRDPFGEGEPEEVKTLVDLSRKLSLSGGGEARGDAALQQQQQEIESDAEDEVFIVGETGEVALRDFPHSRHLCSKFPFSKTPHESYCDQCYCYVCDIPAPCGLWKESSDGHCNATEQDDMWKNLRKAKSSDSQAKILPTSGC
ncbi:hypothetical protein Taro_021455 [Colocasia esculenta]|uniref:Uncharacterized protein n=1 Tax=Colocasia esculenta TaxID=4460 RepID=A0A843V2H8_COLES|nr:hypothetical protein [Colocasia esculenta]